MSSAAESSPACAWCRVPLVGLRPDAVCCSPKHRKARHRFLRFLERRDRAAQSLTIGVSDPPYPDRSVLYRGHRDYAGEVDVRRALEDVSVFDGWILGTSGDRKGLAMAILHAEHLGLDYQIGGWWKGPRPQRRARTLCTWEAVLYKRARDEPSLSPGMDGLVEPPELLQGLVFSPTARSSDPGWIIGAKPGPWWAWAFDLVGARPGDQFHDLYPGTGRGTMAWDHFNQLGSENAEA